MILSLEPAAKEIASVTSVGRFDQCFECGSRLLADLKLHRAAGLLLDDSGSFARFVNFHRPGNNNQELIDKNDFTSLLAELNSAGSLNFNLAGLKAYYDVFCRHDNILRSYNPLPYSGKVIRYKALIERADPELAQAIGRLPDIWENSEVILLNTDHESIMTGEAVKSICEDLNIRMRRVEK